MPKKGYELYLKI